MPGFDNLVDYNASEYAWKDVKVILAGRPVAGLVDVRYKVQRTTTAIFASGTKAHTITKGNKVFTGSIQLLQSEVEALTEAAQQLYGDKADITDVVFDITVAYASSPTSRIKTDRIESVNIEEFEKGMKQDDPNMVVTLPYKCLDIVYNI